MTDTQESTETHEPIEIEIPAGGNRLGLILASGMGIVMVALIVVLATSETNQGLGPSPLITQAAPLIAGPTVDGAGFDLDDHRGRWVVVNFFSTTCIPCIEEHPELIAFEEANSPSGEAAVVSIAFSDRASNVEDFFERNGGDWSVMVEDVGQYAITYGVAAVPETFLVAPNGIITSKFLGGITQADIENEITRLEGGVATG